MFHLISKVLAAVLPPSTVLVLLILASVALSRLQPRRALWRGLLLASAAAFGAVALLPVGPWLLGGLERRFPSFEPDGRPVAGVIVLGGAFSPADARGRMRPQPSEAVDRLFEAARLARAMPGVPVLVSGGPEDPKTHASEADTVAAYLVRLGVAPARILRERRSRDTYENAQFSRALARPRSGQRWVLVTSAFHMTRAVAAFRRAGFTVQAAPADWRVSDAVLGPQPASANLAALDLALREYTGLVVYRLLNRTDALFPGP